MAGDWIKMRTNLASEPEVIGIADATGLDEDSVVGKLHKLWSWADQHTTDGNALSVTEKWIDRYLVASGFAQAMVSVGWLTITSGGIQFPNFDRHNGQTGKRRALTKNRVQKARNAPSVTEALPDKREEKRREDNSNTSSSPPSGKPKKRKSKSDLDRTYSLDFQRFWDAYPPARRTKKPEAWRAWLKAITRAEPDVIISAALEFALSELAQTRFCPGPEPWLNQDRWDDDREAWKERDGPEPTPTRRLETPMPDLARLTR